MCNLIIFSHGIRVASSVTSATKASIHATFAKDLIRRSIVLLTTPRSLDQKVTASVVVQVVFKAKTTATGNSYVLFLAWMKFLLT